MHDLAKNQVLSIFSLLYFPLILTILYPERNKIEDIYFYAGNVRHSWLHIAYVTTNRGWINVASSAVSILNRSSISCHFHVFFSEPLNQSDNIFPAIQEYYKGRALFNISILPYNEVAGKFPYPKGFWNFWTPFIFARVLIIDIVDCDYLLYLDTDVYGCGDVKEVSFINLGNSLMAGVPDAAPWHSYIGKEHLDTLNLTDKTYFNSGVIYMNIQELRKCDFVNKALKRWAQKQTFYPDQDLLNYLVGDRRMMLDYRFNMHWVSRPGECVLRHFNHKKITHPVVKYGHEDYNYHFDAFNLVTKLYLQTFKKEPKSYLHDTQPS
ncbi:hypothetical protein TRFO_01547 [Tritrichomonas foetus]|uniref:Glycosyl transferase family 8 protein n=1 Tax=Tritrichomonas foetus TaxID=1144522 RepID=A0A1J4JXF9_9EUKA|nr:hypothetical protein TRFO_01547 [Tritrichomonas foetus]|eukprot:OHT03839.1 hypothetical protein TRFO_01547 [Tritrichomonas foetus]